MIELFENDIAELGVGLDVYDVWVYTNFDVPAGSFVQFDLSRASASSPEPGVRTSVLANVVQPTLVGAKFGWHGVTLTAARAGQRVLVRLRGETYLLIGGNFTAGASIAVGDDADVIGKRVKAIALESGGTSGELGFGRVFLDGLRGFRTPMGSESPGGGRPGGGFDLGGFGGATAPPSPGWGQGSPSGSLANPGIVFTVGGVGSVVEF